MLNLKLSGFEIFASKLANKLNTAIEKETENRVKELIVDLAFVTPKDTGYAASRWTYDSVEKPVITYKVKFSNFLLNLGSKEYIVSNDTPYIVYLNKGSSKQAPSYFIEQTILSNGFKINGTIVNSGG